MDESTPESRNDASSCGHERGKPEVPPSPPSGEAALRELEMELQAAESRVPPDEEKIAELLNSRALIHARLGNGAAAVADIQRSIEWFLSSKPSDHLAIARLYATFAESLQAAGDESAAHDALTSAIALLEHAVGAEPYELPACRFRRGCISYRRGEYPEALADIQRYTAWLQSTPCPDPALTAAAQMWMGVVHLGMRGWRSADAFLSKAAEWADREPVSERIRQLPLYRDLLSVRLELEDLKGAHEIASKIIDLLVQMPERQEDLIPRWYAHRSEIRHRLGLAADAGTDIELALVAVRSGLTIEPATVAHWHYLRGSVRRARHDFAGAEADFSEAIRLLESAGSPQLPVLSSALGERSNARFHLGNLQGARADSIRAIEEHQRRDPADTAGLVNLLRGQSHICCATGDLASAAEYVNRAITAVKSCSKAPASRWADTLVQLEDLRTTIVERRSRA
ncbi:MAG: hypothetical protein ACOYN0_18375 [Phycisphaerales bacterium]